jgi:hypothetical protein
MAKSLPPVGKVMNWLEATGFTVSYLYEDLVFVESNAFLIHFDKSDPPEIQILTNSECDSAKAAELEELLIEEAVKHDLEPVKGGKFTLSQKNDEEIDIRFED